MNKNIRIGVIAVIVALGISLFTISDSYALDSTTEGRFPVHGNYCGENHTDPTFQKEPNDTVDKVCKNHDLCYHDYGLKDCRCDSILLNTMSDAIDAAPTIKGKAAGKAIMLYFEHADCLCNLPGAKPYWSSGGKCLNQKIFFLLGSGI